MSRLAVTIIALFALLLGSSCVPSIHGIATEGNVTFRPDLVGSWVSDDNESAWVFESDNDRSYRLTLETSEGTDGSFYAALVELEGELFLDLFPSDNDPNWPIKSFYGLHFLPLHTFMHVELENGSLSLRMMDPSWLEAWLDSNPDGIANERESMIVVTASTAELQAWLPTLLDAEPIAGAGMMGNDSTAFTDAVVLGQGVLKPRAEMSDEELYDEMQELMDPRPVTEPVSP